MPVLTFGPLRGREHEWLQVARAVTAARDRPTSTLTIEGPDGIGKTRLLLELVELITGLVEEDLVTVRGGKVVLARLALPQRLRARILDQVTEVSAQARQLVQIASAIGASCSLSDIAGLLRASVASLTPAVGEALAGGLLVNTGDRLAFPHELVRRVIAASLPPAAFHALQAELYGRPLLGMAEPGRAHPVTEPDDLGFLTQRQRQIAELAGQGLTNRQIAARIYLSPHTVNYHIRHIFKKLGITSRLQLARLVPG